MNYKNTSIKHQFISIDNSEDLTEFFLSLNQCIEQNNFASDLIDSMIKILENIDEFYYSPSVGEFGFYRNAVNFFRRDSSFFYPVLKAISLALGCNQQLLLGLSQEGILPLMASYLPTLEEPEIYYAAKIVECGVSKFTDFAESLLPIFNVELLHRLFSFSPILKDQIVSLLKEVCYSAFSNREIQGLQFADTLYIIFNEIWSSIDNDLLDDFFMMFYYISNASIWNDFINKHSLFEITIGILKFLPHPFYSGLLLLHRIITTKEKTDPVPCDLLCAIITEENEKDINTKIFDIIEAEVTHGIGTITPCIAKCIIAKYGSCEFEVKKSILTLLRSIIQYGTQTDILMIIENGANALILDSLHLGFKKGKFLACLEKLFDLDGYKESFIREGGVEVLEEIASDDLKNSQLAGFLLEALSTV